MPTVQTVFKAAGLQPSSKTLSPVAVASRVVELVPMAPSPPPAASHDWLFVSTMALAAIVESSDPPETIK